MTPVLPVSFWRNENDFLETIPVKQPYQFISPDGTTFLPTDENFVSGELYYGSKLNGTLRAFGFAPVIAGSTLLCFGRIWGEDLRRDRGR